MKTKIGRTSADTIQHAAPKTATQPTDMNTDGSVPYVGDAPAASGGIAAGEGNIGQPGLSPGAPRRSPPREPVGEYLDPAAASVDDSHTLQLAISQTIAARACLYWPSRELAEELQTSASGLLGFIHSLEAPNLVIGLSARLLGPEGLDSREYFAQGQREGESQEDFADRCWEVLKQHLTIVAANPNEDDNPELGHSRAVTIALLGDVGALMAATGATTGTDRHESVSRDLKEAFSAYALSLEGKDDRSRGLVDWSIMRCKALGGGEIVGPSKKRERIRPSGEELLPRTGIHDCGKEADAALGRTEKTGHLRQTKWATARVHGTRVALTEEPLAGHMSASPSEILWTWDVLARRGLAYAYAGSAPMGAADAAMTAIEQAPTAAQMAFSPGRVAGACAFLVGCGYHSALEVLHGAMVYVGQTPEDEVVREAAAQMAVEKKVSEVPVDAGAIFHGGAATALVTELFDDMTSDAGREAKASPKNDGGFAAATAVLQLTDAPLSSTAVSPSDTDSSLPSAVREDSIGRPKSATEVPAASRAAIMTNRYTLMARTIASEGKIRKKHIPTEPKRPPWR